MKKFLQHLKQIVPHIHYEAVAKTFIKPKQIGLRLNTLKIQDATFLSELCHDQLIETPFTNTYLADAHWRDTLTHSTEFQEGFFYVQNLSSMLPALLLELQPQQEILDLCAAPGSKTSQMACIVNNEADIAAVERNKKRFHKLKDNLQQQGVTCVKLFLRDGKTVYRHCADKFDRVLVDAPCSSEAVFDNTRDDLLARWDLKNIKKIARDQWQLLYSGFMSLKPGGILIYSTCTFEPLENEAVVNKLIKKFGDAVSIQPIEVPFANVQPGLTEWEQVKFDPKISNCLRILPTEVMEGFFMAKIVKVSS